MTAACQHGLQAQLTNTVRHSETMANPMNGNGNHSQLPATLPSPADFALGSAQSRAVARFQVKNDHDARAIYSGVNFLGIFWLPECQAITETAIYQRGKQLCENQPPTGIAELLKTMSDDELRFLSQEMDKACRKEFIEAWKRQFRGRPCPLKPE